MSNHFRQHVFDAFNRWNGCPKCGKDIRVDDKDGKYIHIHCCGCAFTGWVLEEDTLSAKRKARRR